MANLNIAFLETYKRLDNLCKDLYRTETGVTSYIDEMRSTPASLAGFVPDWNFQLGQLRRLRHIRNQLTHESGTLDSLLCTQEDINWLNAFYQSLLNQTDPIALLYASRHVSSARRVTQQAHQNQPMVRTQRPNNNQRKPAHSDGNFWGNLLVFLFIFGLCCAVVGAFWWMMTASF